MKRHAAEIELLENALKAFRKATGLRAVVERFEFTGPHGQRADALVRLTALGREMQFVVELKRKLTNATLGAALHQLARFPQKGLLVTDYVNPNMAERLKNLDAPFIDTVGNAYLNEPPVLVYLKGQGPPGDLRKIQITRAFRPTGLKVLFAFLCRPKLVNAPYRDIARAASVALGTVGWVITDLKQLGYVLDIGKRERRLVQKGRLLERWAAAYPEQLKPKLLIGRFAAPETDWWKDAQIRNFHAYWGGEIAAARLTQYLKPEFITIYVRDMPGKLQLTYKLKENPKGKTEVLKAFWNVDCDWMERETVHPLLVYTDLLATGDARNIETARMLYDKKLAGLIGED